MVEGFLLTTSLDTPLRLRLAAFWAVDTGLRNDNVWDNF